MQQRSCGFVFSFAKSLAIERLAAGIRRLSTGLLRHPYNIPYFPLAFSWTMAGVHRQSVDRSMAFMAVGSSVVVENGYAINVQLVCLWSMTFAAPISILWLERHH